MVNMVDADSLKILLVQLFEHYNKWVLNLNIKKAYFPFKEKKDKGMQPYVFTTLYHVLMNKDSHSDITEVPLKFFEKEVENRIKVIISNLDYDLSSLTAPFKLFDKELGDIIRVYDKFPNEIADCVFNENLPVIVTDMEGVVIHDRISYINCLAILDDHLLCSLILDSISEAEYEKVEKERKRIENSKVQPVDRKYGSNNWYNTSHWTCQICDGDSETGCLYFDPTECPRR